MNLLKMIHPVGWEVLFVKDNEQLLRMYGGDKTIYAKIRLVSFKGIREDLQDEFRQRVDAVTTLVDESYSTFILNHLRWYVDSYVVSDKECKYRSYCYTLLDESYVAFELVTRSSQSVLMFVSEAKRLINSIDYSALNRNNRFMVNDNVYIVDTPASYRFSNVSTDDRIVFIGEKGYAVVNVGIANKSLAEFVDACIDVGNASVENCEIEITRVGTGANCEWIAYRAKCDNKTIGTCAYVKQVFGDDAIISFLYESGEITEPIDRFFHFRKEV